METFSGALIFVLPIFLVLIFLEMIIAKLRNKEVFNSLDTVSSLSSGITNTLFKILGLTIYIVSYDFLLNHFTLFPLKWTALQYIIAFFVLDLYVYWWHRWRHEYNVLWNEHVIHHSSEEYNLPVALRQTISDIINPATFLLLPAAIFGVPMDVIVVMGVVMLFGGFWYHTQLINKMGILELVFVTPSHHRIHHAINPEYIDKNYGGILIIWDKIFGTFQEELPHVKPIYGLTRPVSTYNPIKINFLHLSLLIKDAWRTSNIWDKVRIWFMPTGWRPSDVEERFPISSIKNPSQLVKYQPPASVYLKAWAWLQLITTFLLLLFMISQLPTIGKTNLFLYSAFIFISVYSYTSLMDKSKYAWVVETLRLLYALAIIRLCNGWFDLDSLIPYGTLAFTIYLAISFFACLAFVHSYPKLKNQIQVENV